MPLDGFINSVEVLKRRMRSFKAIFGPQQGGHITYEKEPPIIANTAKRKSEPL